LFDGDRFTRISQEKFLEFAKNQATQSIRLSSHLSEMMAAPPRDFKSEEHKREQEYGRKQLQEKKIRYQNYEKIQDQLRAGKHLGALSEIAKTYLGRFSEFNDIKSAIGRVDELVGKSGAKLPPIPE
jgi:hypothetical protein